MGHLLTFKKPKKNATNPAITISQRNTISNNVLLLLCTAMPSKLTQLEGQMLLQNPTMLCFTIIQCSVAKATICSNSPSYNALFHHLLHHHSLLCCTIIQYTLLHPITMPHHTICPVALWYNDLFYTIIQCIVVPSYNAVLHHHSILCCTISQCSVAQTTSLCCTFIRCTIASSYNSLLHHHNAMFHLVHHHTMLGCNVIHCLLFVPSFTDLLQQHTMLQCTCTVKLAITKTTLSRHCSILSYEGLKMRLCRVMPYVSFNAFLSFCKWPFIPYRHNNKQ